MRSRCGGRGRVRMVFTSLCVTAAHSELDDSPHFVESNFTDLCLPYERCEECRTDVTIWWNGGWGLRQRLKDDSNYSFIHQVVQHRPDCLSVDIALIHTPKAYYTFVVYSRKLGAILICLFDIVGMLIAFRKWSSIMDNFNWKMMKKKENTYRLFLSHFVCIFMRIT